MVLLLSNRTSVNQSKLLKIDTFPNGTYTYFGFKEKYEILIGLKTLSLTTTNVTLIFVFKNATEMFHFAKKFVYKDLITANKSRCKIYHTK